MPKQLEQGKKIKRLIRVYGIEGLVELTVSHEGLSLRIPRTKKSVSVDWPKVVDASCTPNDVPAHLFGDSMKFLQHEVAKVQKARVKRATK